MEHRYSLFSTTVPKRMEIEEEQNKRRQHTKIQIYQKRNLLLSPNTFSSPSQVKDIQMSNPSIDIQIINDSIQFLLSTPTNKEKSSILKSLKTLRRELSKPSVTKDAIEMMFNKFPTIYSLLSQNLLDFKNSEIQFETIWILNNLYIYCYNFKLEIQFTHIGLMLVQLLKEEKQFSNSGVRNLIFEKFFCLIGNLIYIDDRTLTFFLENDIIKFLFTCLNSRVGSLRNVCLWNLNKIYKQISHHSQLYTSYIPLFIDKNAISYYKFVLQNLEFKKNFDEIYEFYWLINEIFKSHPEIANFLFFCNKEKEILNQFKSLLSICLISKVLQPSIRLISNLIVLANNDIIRDKLCELVFIELPLISFIQDVIIAENSKYAQSIEKDVLLLVYNLSIFQDKKTYSFFGAQIVKALNTLKTNSDIKIFGILLCVYYRNLCASQIALSERDNNIILLMINNYPKFANDIIVLLIIIDVLYIYIANSRKQCSNWIESQILEIKNGEIKNSQEMIRLLNEMVKIII